MTKDQLIKFATQGKLDELVTELLSGTPHAFEKKPAEYPKFKEQLGAALNVDAAHIVVVGSGRFGFSLAPYKFGRPFSARSDLDIVIVSQAMFDAAWLELIRYDFKSLTFERDVADSLKEHRSNNVFWGYLEPYKLKAALSIYKKIWFPAFAALGFFRAAAGREVKARVYRTWDHARNYHSFGLRLVANRNPGEKK